MKISPESGPVNLLFDRSKFRSSGILLKASEFIEVIPLPSRFKSFISGNPLNVSASIMLKLQRPRSSV